MKYFLLIALSMLMFSCSSDVRFEMDKFNGSATKTFMSQFKIIDDKVYKIDEKSPYTGKISGYLNDTLKNEYEVKDGDFENIKLFYLGEIALEVHKKGKTLSSQSYPIKGNSLVEVMKCNFINVTNASLIDFSLNMFEGSCETKFPLDKIVVNSQTTKTGNLITKQSIAKHIETNSVIYKELLLAKYQSGLDFIVVNFKEKFENTVINKYDELYKEEITIQKNENYIRFNILCDEDKTINLHSDINNFNGQHCSEMEILSMPGLYNTLAENERYNKDPCVTDGLKILNEVLKKNITREDLKQRIQKKQGNNLFYTLNPEDISFYF